MDSNAWARGVAVLVRLPRWHGRQYEHGRNSHAMYSGNIRTVQMQQPCCSAAKAMATFVRAAGPLLVGGRSGLAICGRGIRRGSDKRVAEAGTSTTAVVNPSWRLTPQPSRTRNGGSHPHREEANGRSEGGYTPERRRDLRG
eukprot:363794-Chlamydomonas_euryale.AAC.3